jgi:hypothetical protein
MDVRHWSWYIFAAFFFLAICADMQYTAPAVVVPRHSLSTQVFTSHDGYVYVVDGWSGCASK